MRKCGECTLCCKIPRIVGLKPSNAWCHFCDVGKGCSVYENRPQPCKDFTCWWLTHEDMPEDMRPDKVHMYVAGSDEEETLRVRVDTDWEESWKGSPVVDYARTRKHVLVVVGNQMTFLSACGRTAPEKLVVEWTL
jgi:hypothetical protein